MGKCNEREVAWREYEQGEATFRRKLLGAAAGGDDLGCSLYELPPGKRSWPYHYHEANEEAIYVLSGSGSVRLDDGTTTLEAGDYVALPTGEQGSHGVVNDGDEPLRFLVVSTMFDPDVTSYPDSGKFGVFAGSPPGRESDRRVDGYYRLDDDVDYWEGEE
jgi:uncharacterized cupin superfamily protein